MAEILTLKKLIFVTTFAMTLSLQGCGKKGDGGRNANPVPVPVENPQRDPNVQGQVDPMNTVLQNLQNEMGNLTVLTAVTINGIAVKPGTYTWVQLYSRHIRPMICGKSPAHTCDMQNVNFANLNFQSFYSGNQARQGYVEFRNINRDYGFETQKTTIYQIYELFVRVNYAFYSSPQGFAFNNPNFNYNGGFLPPQYGNNLNFTIQNGQIHASGFFNN